MSTRPWPVPAAALLPSAAALLPPAAALLVLAACGGESSERALAGTTVRDSAGITIVEFDPEEVPSRPLAGEPTWSFESVRTEGGDHILSGVEPRPLEDGRLAIAERSTMRVWIGTPDGDDWSWVAGQGDGPSEVQSVTDLEVGADGSLWIQDGARLRIVRFTSDGEFLEAIPFDDAGLRGPNWSIRSGAHYFLGGGDGVGPGDGPGVFRTSAPLVRRSAGGSVDTLTTLPTAEWYVFDGGVGGPLLRPNSFGAGAPDGHWVGDNAHPVIEFRSEGDAPLTIVRWTRIERDMERLGDSVRHLLLDQPEVQQAPPEMRARIGAFPVTEAEPQFTGLVERFDGGVGIGPWWPRVPVPAQRPAGEWTLVDASGRPVERLALPGGFEPTWFGDDHVIGVATDELGREMVQRWEIAG